jgi:hypothetical protein
MSYFLRNCLFQKNIIKIQLSLFVKINLIINYFNQVNLQKLSLIL